MHTHACACAHTPHTDLSKENITIESSVDLRISFYPNEAVLLAVVQPMSSSSGPDQPLSLVHLHPHCIRQQRHTQKRGHGTHPSQPHPHMDLFNHTHIWTCSTTPTYRPVQPHTHTDLFNHTHIRTCSTTPTYRPVQPHPLTYFLEQTHNSYWHTSQPSPPLLPAHLSTLTTTPTYTPISSTRSYPHNVKHSRPSSMARPVTHRKITPSSCIMGTLRHLISSSDMVPYGSSM